MTYCLIMKLPALVRLAMNDPLQIKTLTVYIVRSHGNLQFIPETKR